MTVKMFLIRAILFLIYGNVGWTIGYYEAHPSLVTSHFWQVVLNPLQLSAYGDDSLLYQCSSVFFGLLWLILQWIFYIFELFFYGGVAKLLIL
jgi:hypothetical protein